MNSVSSLRLVVIAPDLVVADAGDQAAVALAEARRVLKPNGQLRYLEHGLHDDSRVAARQRLIEPVWKVFSGGCHLTRDPDELVREAGFELIESTRHTMPGPPITNALYEGVAVPAGHS